MTSPERDPTATDHPTATHHPPGDDLVTVLIPALNEAGFIDRCLRSVRDQDHARLQIVVVDGGSTDDTLATVARQRAEDDRVELVENPGGLIPRSLNRGLQEARGRWLVRVDAHSTVGPDYVRQAVSRLREGCWGGVGGRKNGVGRTPAGRAIAAALGSPFGVGNSVYHHGTAEQEVDHIPFGAYPVELVRSLGGWDERLPANEDFEFDFRLQQAGHRLLFDPRLVIDWNSRQTVADLYRQYRRYGRGKFGVARLHPRSLRARHLVPPGLVAYLAVAAVVGFRRPSRAGVMVSPYALAVLAATLSTGRQLNRPGDRVHLPGAFVAMHIGWGVGFWAGVGERCRAAVRAARSRGGGGGAR